MKVRVWPVLVAALPMAAQSLLDLQSQAKNVNFSGAAFTRPFKTGTTLPVACQVGDMFFKSDAPAGSNLYACTATDTWTLETGGAGGPAVGFTANAAGAALTFGTDCAASTPCNVRFTNRVVSVTASATATLTTGTSPAGIYVYVDATTSRITLANSGSAVVNCDANCDVLAGSAFPADSVPLYVWPVTVAGSWDGFQGVFDKRAQLGTSPAAAGSNLALTVAGGKQILSYDPTTGLTPTGPLDASGASLTKPNRTVASDPSGACPANNEVVLSTASGNLYSCLSGTWKLTGDGVGAQVAGGAGAGNVAVLNAGGNLDPTAGGGAVMSWDGQKLTVRGAGLFRLNNAGAGETCSGSIAIGESQTNLYRITLTGNCTATSSAPQAGHLLTFLICQDATGGRTFTWPSNYQGAMTVASGANQCSRQLFAGDGTTYYAVAAGVSD